MGGGVMMAAENRSWLELNQKTLVREFQHLRERLGDGSAAQASVEQRVARDEASKARPAAIDVLAETFGLSVFEREVVLLCAGVELDSELAARCAEVAGRQQRSPVTFSLALSALREPHWSALAASAPLRRYRLINVDAEHGLTQAALHVDERVLYYLTGINRLDPRLEQMLYPRTPPQWMSEDHFRLATEVLGGFEGDALPPSILHLCGDDPAGQEGVAALLAHRARRELLILRHEDTPSAGAEMEQFLQLWMRESLLLPALLLMQWENETPSANAKQLAERLPCALMIASRESLRLHRPVESHEVRKPGPTAQLQLWQDALGPASEPMPEVLGQIAEQFRFSADTIGTIAAGALQGAEAAEPKKLASRLWRACRLQSRPRLEGLAERIDPAAGWDDLILADQQKDVLQQLAAQARNRMKVNETWGFAERGRRGLGLSALFAGPSGTGKTMAAEVLAAELKLDLYRIDLSAVVSKYIGETEKNLKRVFDAAESGGVMLLFDEADALFGKRTETRDSHDRYANIEVGYLLQRMESFEGLAILTTNLKASLDKSFQRRLRFTVDFPFPDAAQRQAIWAKVFPQKTPTADLHPARLATLNMAGGNIRNIALNAAFLAAEDGASVGMQHILKAAQLEAVKVERPLAELETRGWV
jgi:hypothetical protein